MSPTDAESDPAPDSMTTQAVPTGSGPAEPAAPQSPAAPQPPFAPPSGWAPQVPEQPPYPQQPPATAVPEQPPSPEQTSMLPQTFQSPFAPQPGWAPQLPQQPPYAQQPPATPVPDQPPYSEQPGYLGQPPYPGQPAVPPQTVQSPYAPPMSVPPMAAPTSAPPTSAPPTSSPPEARPAEASVPPWMAGAWAPSQPAPVFAPPQGVAAPAERWAPSRQADPFGGDEYGGSTSGARGSRFTVGLVIGLAVAVVLGVGGYFIGAATHSKAGPAPTSSGTPSPSLQPYEASQKRVNEPKFTGDLVPLAQLWLPYMGLCAADTDPNGPKLLTDESKHVNCRYGSVALSFAQFKTQDAVPTERTYREKLKLQNGSVFTGQLPPTRKAGGASHAQGDYVEYSLNGQDGRPLCGIWWNRDGAPAAMFMEALCNESLGGSFAPLRDLWQRYS